MANLIIDKIDGLIMDSMKAHQHVRTRTLRLMKSAFLEAEKAPGASKLDEYKEIQILQKMVKQRQDARHQYIDANRIDLAKNEFEEMQIIQEFLPKPISEEELLDSFNILEIPHIKSCMGQLIKELKNIYPTADGKLVAKVVQEHLLEE